jgi:hypothetical protein
MALPQLPILELAEGGQWIIETVDSDGSVGARTSIDLDGRDYPHISYLDRIDGSNFKLKYAKWTGREWNITDVDTVSGYTSQLWDTTLVIDSNDLSHIGYQDPPEALMHAVLNGEEWTIETVDSGSRIGGCNSMALDRYDNPHYSYCDSLNSSLKYARLTGGFWSIDTVEDSGQWVNGWTSIAVDTKDIPHISYFVDWPDFDLKYAKWTGSRWNVETVDSEGSTGGLSSIAIDSNDRPHITYHGNHELKYAKWTGSDWSIESLFPGGSDPSLRLDNNDTPHIAYHDVSSKGLRYAKWSGDHWDVEIVDSPDSCFDVSLALDSSGYPHISYHFEDWNDGLRYARKAELAPPSRSVGLDVDPDTLNLKSKGNWITAYLTTENITAYDIDASSLRLNDFLNPSWWEVKSNLTLMVKFDRESAQAILSVSDSVRLEVTGQWKDGEAFEAHDYIRVIDPGR